MPVRKAFILAGLHCQHGKRSQEGQAEGDPLFFNLPDHGQACPQSAVTILYSKVTT